MNEQLSEIEQWQNAEDARLEYEGYCNKIRIGLNDGLDEKSGERALWELVQNARDLSCNARIKIELSDKCLVFSHHGEPFDYTSFRALVKQDSSKDRTESDKAGQYGTGFMTTHSFNRKVYVSGPFAVKIGDDIKGYVQVKDFELDRTSVDKPEEGPQKMKNQLDKVKKFCKSELSKELEDDTTSFRYDLTPSQIDDVSKQLSNAISLMPFVLVINSRIKEIEIYNHIKNEHIVLTKTIENNSSPLEDGWSEVSDVILSVDKTTYDKTTLVCKSLQSEKDIIIIPPFPTQCGEVTGIPSLFLWFPLLGTEKFGVNFIFHSKRFYPVEKRNNIMLPGSTLMKQEKGGENSKVLREMSQELFAYYAKPENAKTLDRQMCGVTFCKHSCDDEETQKFYDGMQKLWKQNIPYWKVLPIEGGYYAVSDKNVKLLDPEFYSVLTEEQRANYEPILAKFAQLPQKSDGKPYLMPLSDLIAWSETVDGWKCKRDSEFFITVEDVCKAIKDQTDGLHSFLELMKDSGNAKVMDDYPILPNRFGKLYSKKELRSASFMTDEVFDLVKVVMGDVSQKICNPDFVDVCEFTPYNQSELQNDITVTIGKWRKNVLVYKKEFQEEYLSALIKFCSASNSHEISNVRGRMMPLVTKFYGKEFCVQHTIKFKEDNEEDFYSTAFDFLLDYTLYQLCKKDVEWVKQKKDWLKLFIYEYTPLTNERHRKRLDEYGVLPNQKNELCKLKDLRKNNGVPDEMVLFYSEVCKKDLREKWIDENFVELVELEEDSPNDIANEIEQKLVIEMKHDTPEDLTKKIVRQIILKIGEDKRWEEWFGQINDKKAAYTFNMQSGDAQKDLFTLMDIGNEAIGRLAKIAEKGDINDLLDKMERQKELEYESNSRFSHLLAIGKHIEEALRKRISSDLIMVENPHGNAIAEDEQDGQDIKVKIKSENGWRNVFYIEVKSKWDFSEPAHMSTGQIKKAVEHREEYALCCVDLREHKNEDLLNLSEDTIIACTKVKMDIGEKLSSMVNTILEKDKISDDIQIKLSNYRSNMSAKVFEEGEPFESFLEKLVNVVEKKLEK